MKREILQLNNRKSIILIILTLIFLVIWLGNVFIDLKMASNILSVKIEVNGDLIDFNRITAFRLSPNGNMQQLLKDNNNNAFYSFKKGYFRKIHINIENQDYKKIDEINVEIGKKSFRSDQKNILEHWKIIKNKDHVLLESKNKISGPRSRLSIFKDIINWQGDLKVFLKTFIIYLLIYLIFIFLIYLIIRNIFKRIPMTLKKEIFKNKILQLNEEDNIFMRSNYEESDKEFILKNNLSITKKMILSVIYDRTEKNMYRNIFYILFFIVIAVAIIMRFSINQLPYCTGDVKGYIQPALEWFDTGNFTHHHGRSFPYPLFVLFVLRIFNDFSYISIIQHVIGVLTGLFLFFTIRNIFKYFLKGKINTTLTNIIALLIMAIYLFTEGVIVLEHYLLRESIYPFFIIIEIFFMISFINSVKENKKSYFIYGTLYFIFNYFLFVFQPRYGLTLILNITIFIICLIYLKKEKYKKILLLIIPIIICIIFIYIPENILIKNETAMKSFLYSQLFFSHGKIITIELEKDIKDKNFKKYDKDILNSINDEFHKQFKSKAKKKKYLGYSVNDILYGKGRIILENKFKNEEYINFCKYYFLKSILKHPFLYLKKVFLEMTIFYNFSEKMYSDREHLISSMIWEYSYDHLPIGKYEYRPYREYESALNNYKNSYYNMKKIEFPGMYLIYQIFGRTYLIVLFIFLTIIIFIVIKNVKIKNKYNDLFFGFIVLILYFYNFCINLTNSMIYTLDLSRYIHDQHIIVLISQVLAIIFILNIFSNKIFKNRSLL